MSSGATVVLSSRPAAPLSPYRYPLRLPSMSSSRTGSGALVSRETGPGACPSAVEGRGHSPVVVDYRIQNRSGGFTRTSPDVPPPGPVSASHAGRRCLGRHRILSVSRETYRHVLLCSHACDSASPTPSSVERSVPHSRPSCLRPPDLLPMHDQRRHNIGERTLHLR